MAKAKSIIFLLLAVFLGLVATRQITKYIEDVAQRGKESVKPKEVILTQDVVIAGTDVPWGTRLTDGQLKVTTWPKDCVPNGTFLETKDLIGRAVRTPMVRGEPVLDLKLAPEGFKEGMTGIIPDGKRAITIRVNEIAGVGGFVLPGSRVDIILTMDTETATKGGDKKTVSKVVLENMLVLAIDQKMTQDDTKPVIVDAVTLLASPEESEKLTLASSKGLLQLAMRNGIDVTPVATAGIVTEDLLNIGPEEDANAPSKKFEVEVIKGTERTLVTFDMPKQTTTVDKESFEM